MNKESVKHNVVRPSSVEKKIFENTAHGSHDSCLRCPGSPTKTSANAEVKNWGLSSGLYCRPWECLNSGTFKTGKLAKLESKTSGKTWSQTLMIPFGGLKLTIQLAGLSLFADCRKGPPRKAEQESLLGIPQLHAPVMGPDCLAVTGFPIWM